MCSSHGVHATHKPSRPACTIPARSSHGCPLCSPVPLTADVERGEARQALQARYECSCPLSSQFVACQPHHRQHHALCAHHMEYMPHTSPALHAQSQHVQAMAAPSAALSHSPLISSEESPSRLCRPGTSAAAPSAPKLLSANHIIGDSMHHVLITWSA